MASWVQRVLDLFDGGPSPGPQRPSEPLAQVLPNAQFTHPRANRRIRLDSSDVAYTLVRGKRRTIGMVVGPDGLEVRAPRWVGVAEVEAALREKSVWINRKLREARERQERLGAARIDWRDGVVLPYLGSTLQVRLDSSAALKRGSVQLEVSADLAAAAGVERVLRLGLPVQADSVQIRDAVQAWLMRQARQLFTERLDHYAPQLGVEWHRLSLSSAVTRWGSASIDRAGRHAIRLNWRLVHHRLGVIDYVVAHELSHLRVMDHSPRFWDTVHSVMPDYAERRRVLREEPLPPWA